MATIPYLRNISWASIPLSEIKVGDYHEAWCQLDYGNKEEGNVLTGVVTEVINKQEFVVKSLCTDCKYHLTHQDDKVDLCWEG